MRNLIENYNLETETLKLMKKLGHDIKDKQILKDIQEVLNTTYLQGSYSTWEHF